MKCQSPGNQQLWQHLSLCLLHFFQSPVTTMVANYMHEIENNNVWRDEMSYGGDTWNMGRIFEELTNYASV